MSWTALTTEVREAFDVGARPGRIMSVQGARGIAIFLVFLIHLLELLCSKAPAMPARKGRLIPATCSPSATPVL